MYTELARVQRAIKVPKSQFNKFGGYNYRNAEDILEAYKKVETESTIIVTDELVILDGWRYIQATAIFFYNGDKIKVKAYAREEEAKKGMDSAQITGSTSSYARKYALNGLLAIDDTKDSDTTNTHGKEAKAPVAKTVDDKTLSALLNSNEKSLAFKVKILASLALTDSQKSLVTNWQTKIKEEQNGTRN